MNIDINLLLEVRQKINQICQDCLPLTENAANCHSYRAYHQIQHWIGVKKMQKTGDGP